MVSRINNKLLHAPSPQEARAFYESLPDLRALVPAVLLGEAKESKEGGSSDAKDPAASAAQPSAAAATDGDAVDGFTPGGGEGGAVGAASAGGAPSAGGGAATGASAAAAGVVGLSRERSRSAGGLAAEADGTVGSDAAGQASTSDGPGGGFFAQVSALHVVFANITAKSHLSGHSKQAVMRAQPHCGSLHAMVPLFKRQRFLD